MTQFGILIFLASMFGCSYDKKNYREQFTLYNNAAIKQEKDLFDSSSQAVGFKIISGSNTICEYLYVYDDPKVVDEEYSGRIFFIIPDSNTIKKEFSYVVPNDDFQVIGSYQSAWLRTQELINLKGTIIFKKLYPDVFIQVQKLEGISKLNGKVAIHCKLTIRSSSLESDDLLFSYYPLPSIA